jgi:hypothetical protein
MCALFNSYVSNKALASVYSNGMLAKRYATGSGSGISDAISQGNKFLNYQSDYLHIIGQRKLNLIEETSAPDLGFMEPLTNKSDSNSSNPGSESNPISVEDDALTSKIMDLENQFNAKLAQYIAVYKQYMSDALDQDNVIANYKGKNVKSSGGEFYYVNKFGVARGFSTPAWDKKPASCPAQAPGDDSVSAYNRMQKGQSYIPGQPCNLDGTVIRNSKTGHAAWIDPKGVRHWYPSGEISSATARNGGCPLSTMQDVSDEIYNMYPKGTDMTAESRCVGAGDMDSGLRSRIVSLNQELLDLANQIYQEVEQMEELEGKVDTKVVGAKQQLMNEIANLNSERDSLAKLERETQTLRGEFQENKIMVRSNYYNYMVWTVAAITLGAIVAYRATS